MRNPDGSYYYTIGQNIGVVDDWSDDLPYVDWFRLVYMEPDDELPIGWLYLAHENASRNIHLHPAGFQYATMIESISEKIVVED